MAGPQTSDGKTAPTEKPLPPRLEGELLEIGQSLSVEDTPAKLRCASCNRLAIEAWKLPCCDQTVCEACRNNLPIECPVCMHTPVTPDVCNPNRSLRLTIRAHCLSIRQKKRGQQNNAQPAEPAEPASAAASPPADTNTDFKEDDVAASPPAGVAAKVADGQSENAATPQISTPTHQKTAPKRAAHATKRNPDKDGSGSDNGQKHRTVFELYRQPDQYTWQALMNGYRQTAGLAEKPIDKALIRSHMKHTEQQLNVLQQSVQTSNMRASDQWPVSRRNSGQSNPNNAEPVSAINKDEQPSADQNHGQNPTPSQIQPQGQVQPQVQSHNQGQNYNAMSNFNQNQAFAYTQQNGGNIGYGQNQAFAQNPNFNGMDTNGMDWNTMVQMQMQWMSMSNMNDPAMMFGNYGGMNGMNNMMNMNMDMGAMNGMNNFGGMPNMAGMNGGAYFPQNGGYNPQQNFGASSMMNNPNSYPQDNRGYSGHGQYNNRGGAYGRGGRGQYNHGRGGWQNFDHQQQHHGQHANMQYQQHPQSFRGNDESFGFPTQQGVARGSPSYEPVNGRNGTGTDAKVLTSSLEDETAGAESKRTAIDETNHTGNAHITQPEDELKKNAAAITEDEPKDDTTTNAVTQTSIATQSNGVNAGSAQPHTAPVNAPTGPKAMRQGQQTSRFQRPQQPSIASAVVASPIALDQTKTSAREDRGRSRSRSPSRAHADGHRARHRSPRNIDESHVTHEQHDGRENRKRKSRAEYHDDAHYGDMDDNRPTKKPRSESPEDGHSKRRHREKDETRHSSRSRRDSSRDRRKDRYRSRSPKKEASINGDERRKDRHRSRSPKRDNDVSDDRHESSRRKSRSDRKREDEHDGSDKKERDRSHKHSSRRHEEDERENRERGTHSSRHRESTSSKHRDRDYERTERDRRRSAISDLAQDGGEFKIRGRSSMNQAGQQESEKKSTKSTSEPAHHDSKVSEKTKSVTENGSMHPPPPIKSDRIERRSSMPTSNATGQAIDIYAEEREKARKVREEMQLKRVEGRRVSGQSLGKRYRDDDGFDAPTGPSGDQDRMHGNKRAKTDMRKHSLKFEGEIGGHHDPRDNRRYR